MIRTGALLVALLGAVSLAAQDRIVAVGDVHGDETAFLAVLRSAGVVDAAGDWIGGETHLVQTGDIPDRGPDTRRILERMMRLEEQAKRAGGAVHALIGNHEAMNVYGDLRYVSPGEFAAFASSRGNALRRRAWNAHVTALRRERPPDDWDAYHARWDHARPPGFFEHREAFKPSGALGRWILGHDAVLKLGDTLFVHGGIGPKYASASISDLNRAIRRELEIAELPKIQGGLAVDPEGPLWYRGLAQNPEDDEAAHVDKLLASFGVKRIVIGHTPTHGTIWPRFGGKVILIDVGLSQAYGGRQACLMIEGDKLTVVHRGKPLPLPETGEAAALLEYVEEAAALEPDPSGLQPLIERLTAEVGAASR